MYINSTFSFSRLQNQEEKQCSKKLHVGIVPTQRKRTEVLSEARGGRGGGGEQAGHQGRESQAQVYRGESQDPQVEMFAAAGLRPEPRSVRGGGGGRRPPGAGAETEPPDGLALHHTAESQYDAGLELAAGPGPGQHGAGQGGGDP